MDRVVCGDVGFGKTEVAMRAAFVAVQAGKQVRGAGADHAARPAALPDFPRPLRGLAGAHRGAVALPHARRRPTGTSTALDRGTVDIVIATHRLLHAQRALQGPRAWSSSTRSTASACATRRLKALRAEVDVLTLTATPIPRTLNMALGGLRDLSLITTPPAERLAIKTFVTRMERRRRSARRACARSAAAARSTSCTTRSRPSRRSRATSCASWCRKRSVRVGHGQMRERDLEQLMLDFYHRRFNLLVCTTIIESGIDVPTANTIIIDRADRFGLAQLHQLRGRVGRSHHRAYAYLIAPPRKAHDAPMRSSASKRSSRWKSWARASCSPRTTWRSAAPASCSASEQSGQIQEIGFALYIELLERAVNALKAGREPELERAAGSGHRSRAAPARAAAGDYMPDVHLRLVLYKRIAGRRDDDGARRPARPRSIDRFGPLPPARTQPAAHRAAQARGARHRHAPARLGPQGGYMLFEEKNSVDPASGHPPGAENRAASIASTARSSCAFRRNWKKDDRPAASSQRLHARNSALSRCAQPH